MARQARWHGEARHRAVPARPDGHIYLIVLVESDLVITRVAIKKGQELAAGCGINDLVYAR
jgi:hypothetical protein